MRHPASFRHSESRLQSDIIIHFFGHILAQLSTLRSYGSILGDHPSTGDLVAFANAALVYMAFPFDISV